MFTDDTKIRLSIEKASKETICNLKRKQAEATREKRTFLILALNDLLTGIHVVKKIPQTDCYDTIRNNYIEALASEFPDLIVAEKRLT